MNNFFQSLIQSFKDKRFRYGAFSTLTIVVIMAILVAVNLVVDQLNLTFDLTPEKRYSLTADSKELLKDISEPVTIYALFPDGVGDATIGTFKELLEQYKDINKNFKIEYKDPYTNPQFLDKYTTEEQEIPVGSVIVEGSERFKVIPVNKLVTEELDYQTYQTYIKSIDLEPQVTNAIKYVLDGQSASLYSIIGHNEQAISQTLKDKLDTSNYALNTLNLITQEIPEDCRALIITTPDRDWTTDEVAKAKAYLENNGRAVFFIDYTNVPTPNLDGLLASFGVEIQKVIIFEGDQQKYFQGNPVNVIPGFEAHEITNSIIQKGYMMLTPMVMSINEMTVKKGSLSFTPLLTTTRSAYGKTGENVQSVNKEAGDIDGPFNLAMAITDTSSGNPDETAKIVVVSTSTLLDDNLNAYILGTNYDFILNTMKWMADRSDDIYISPKTGDSSTLQINSGQAFMIIIFSVIILPAAILICGLYVWFRRRNG